MGQGRNLEVSTPQERSEKDEVEFRMETAWEREIRFSKKAWRHLKTNYHVTSDILM